MQISGRFILLVLACSVLELHKGVLQAFLGSFLMDCASRLKFLFPGNDFFGFGFGFLLFGRFSHVINVLGLVLVFGMGLKFLQIGLSNKRILQFLCDAIGKSEHDQNIRKSIDNCKERVKEDTDFEEDADEMGKERCPEDEESDVLTLRKLVKIERRRARVAYREVDKERTAAASAADEVMAMILRLQNEKSSMEIDANQFKRSAEQKQEHDQRVIESLQWLVMKHESERCLLEKKLQLYKQKLKLYMKDDEFGQFEQLDSRQSFFHDAQEDGR